VTCFSVHPGCVRTEVTRHMNAFMQIGNALFAPVLSAMQKTPEQGAYSSVHVATSPTVTGKLMVIDTMLDLSRVLNLRNYEISVKVVCACEWMIVNLMRFLYFSCRATCRQAVLPLPADPGQRGRSGCRRRRAPVGAQRAPLRHSQVTVIRRVHVCYTVCSACLMYFCPTSL
jgi:hypothetical protein